MRRSAPVGRDVGTSRTVLDLLADHTSPSREVAHATLTLVVFTDYQCPACRLGSPAMDAAVASDQHVRVVYKDWPIFGARSDRAARVAIASNYQGIYPSLHTRLMAESRPLDELVLRQAVERSGGNWPRLLSDLRTHSAAIDRQLDLNRQGAFALGLAGTPAYLAGSILVSGATDTAGFEKAFAQGRSAAER